MKIFAATADYLPILAGRPQRSPVSTLTMAMSFSQTLIRRYSSCLSKSSIPVSLSRTPVFRDCGCCYSTLSDSSALPDAAGDSTPSSASEALTVRIIEDAVHRLIVMRSAPDWLPLVPGASYWVPPKRRNYGVPQLLRSLNNAHLHDVDPEHLISLITSRSWPYPVFYLQDCGNNDSSLEVSEVEETSGTGEEETLETKEK